MTNGGNAIQKPQILLTSDHALIVTINELHELKIIKNDA